MRRKLQLTLLAFGFGIWIPAFGAAREPGLAQLQLDRMISDLASVREGVHYQDEGRVFLLEKIVRALRESVEKRGLGHAQTTHLYHQVIIRFKYSDRFFVFIRTKRNARAIDSLASAVTAIRRETGFDDDPYGQVLLANLEQLHQSIAALLKLEGITDDLRRALGALVPKIGGAIAVARSGDRPIAFEKAAQLHAELKKIYPLLHTLSSRAPGFELVLEILGVSEFIAEFAQVDHPGAKP